MFMCHVSVVVCQVSCVTCHMSAVSCQLSLNATATSTDPPPSNSPTMYRRLLCKDPQIQNNFKNQKKTLKQPKLENI